jgi:hypothetical protein
MSHSFEFIAPVVDGRIELPPEIAARLRLRGIDRLRVRISSLAEEEERLRLRGVDAGTIDRVAVVQRFDRDVAVTVLAGEGAAVDTSLGRRLAGLAGKE